MDTRNIGVTEVIIILPDNTQVEVCIDSMAVLRVVEKGRRVLAILGALGGRNPLRQYWPDH
jgi:hypothetical protein